MSLPSSPSRFSRRDNSVSTSNPRRVDVGKPLGVYDTNSVRDRVRQWQAQGGGVIAAEDIGAEEEKNEKDEADECTSGASQKDSTPRTPSRNQASGGRDPNKTSRSGRSAAKVDEATRHRERSGSAPAKRVVSDGHWRKKRSPPKNKSSPKTSSDAKPEWTQPDDGIRIRSNIESKSDGRRDRSAGKATPKRESVGGDDGIRVYVTPPGSRRQSGRSRRRQSDRADSAFGDGSDLEPRRTSPPVELGRRGKRTTPDKSPRIDSSAAKEESWKAHSTPKANDVENSSGSLRPALSDGRGSQRSHKGNILSQVFGDSRRIFAKQSPEPIVAPRVPSIEAWLNQTPDPFIEMDEPHVDEIPPLRPSPQKRKVTPKETIVADPNHIWDALDTKEGTRRAVSGSRRRKRIPSSAIYEDNPFPEDFDSDTAISGGGKGAATASKFVDLGRESTEPSPPPLKRGLARKSVSSPIRDRKRSQTSRESPKEDNDVASTRSSNLTSSSVEGPDPNNPMRPPGLNLKRPFPSTGRHRLSTIASVETFNSRLQGAAPPSVSEVSERTEHLSPAQEVDNREDAEDHFDPNSLKRNNSRLTKHADLISVLSLPRGATKSIKSARSIRTNRSRLDKATTGDLMQEIAMDESKYMRELRTLVDGVIPVLLACVLSKADSAVAAGLFQPTAIDNNDDNFTRPIVDMGIALERLKTLHKRIPLADTDKLLTWAHGAQRVYAEYLKAWRMGFQDVVVNLAPAVEDESSVSKPPRADLPGFEGGLPRNEDGDVVNGDGERVDVAFLLKRPLVRLKYLAKTLKGINFIKPSVEAESLATKYQSLVNDARKRSNEERARLEDEAAANIDPTRARDPRTLAPLDGVTIDRRRRVRARDHFNLALQHSSGQCVDCRVELLLRDEADGMAGGGDLLICEVDGTGRWLLFPPVQFGLVSARNGDSEGEIILMIRGLSANATEWQELFSLQSEDERAGFEWVQMLGLTPVPPRLSRSRSFINAHQRRKSAPSNQIDSLPSANTPAKSRTPSPREVEVPIGEQANNASKKWEDPTISNSIAGPSLPSSRDAFRSPNKPQETPHDLSRHSTNYVDQVNDLRSLPSQHRTRKSTPSEPARTPRSFKEALGLSGTSTSVGLRRSRAKRLSRHGEGSPQGPRSIGSREDREPHMSSPEATEVGVQSMKTTNDTDDARHLALEARSDNATGPRQLDLSPKQENSRPSYDRSWSSVPTMELPYIPKARQNSPPTTPAVEVEEEPMWSTPPQTQLPASASKLAKRRPVSLPPAAPDHGRSSPAQLDATKTPVLEKGRVKPRRSSSPLKHEYEPSTASESSCDSDASTVERNGATSVSDSSDEEELEEGDAPTLLMPIVAPKRLLKPSPRASLYSTTNGSIKPSDSASQAPYKTVPPQPTMATKTIASIFSWSDTGCWQSLHPDECSIVITPGLIEAFEMSAAHSNTLSLPSAVPATDEDKSSDLASNLTSQNDVVQGKRPLVALELTPLVPLRRGTAIDISIRSPPTSNSQITSGNNVMFRSRNPEECEGLYALINQSRINNPTFIALQNARGPFESGNSFSGSMDRRSGMRPNSSRSSWFGGFGRSNSYRASSAPTPSIAPSDSSIGSMSSAFSALKRFSNRSSGVFNISRSTIGSRVGSRTNSVYTSSDNSSGSGTSSPIPPGLNGAGKDAPIGLSNAKIRLYIRETASKWRDMGSARLTIMRAERNNTGPDGRPLSSYGHQPLHEKRVVVHGKTKGEVLLDAQLGESCFERVARTGIAMSVWEDVVGPNGEVGVVGAVGGVAGGRAKVYMIQVCSRC